MSAVEEVATADQVGIAGIPVELIEVVKTYSGQHALSGVNLRVEPGEFVALLGPSGCGKTTALRVLSGLEQIDGGSILIDGTDVVNLAVNKRDIGMVFQSYSLFPHMTALQNVEFGLRMRKVDGPSRRARASEALEMVGLGHLEQRFAHQLSGGQQQRVALARALVTRPRVLLLDEPLSALDAKVRVALRDEIRRIQKELGITTLFVTHDQEEALAVADRVAVMNAGNIEQIGTPEELYLNPSTSFVADFVGLSNKLDGTVAGGVVTVYGQALDVLGDAPAPGAVTAFVRPEDIALAQPGAAGSGSAEPELLGTVVSTSFLGSLRRTFVRLADDTVVAVQHDVSDRPATGDQLALRFKGRPVAVAPRE